MARFYKRNGSTAYDALNEAVKHRVILNHVRDTPDSRDLKFKPPLKLGGPLPALVNLSGPSGYGAFGGSNPNCPLILDQNGYGSCQSNCLSNALKFDLNRQGISFGQPSRLFIYYNARSLTGIQKGDPGSSGAAIRNTIKTVAQTGYCDETLWPYSEPPNNKPTAPCYAQAKNHKNILYQRVDQNLVALKSVLNMGLPICYGISVYWASFGAVVQMPSIGESLGGGHATVLVGYDDGTTFGPNRFLAMNSWGAGWGFSGYYTIPYQFVLDPVLAFDFWVLQHVT